MTDRVFWLLVECQNFASSIFDTQDLSTIRGGSLLLRDRITLADRWLRTKLGESAVKTATLGGSLGIWQLSLGDETENDLIVGLRAALAAGKGRHAACAVAMIRDEGGSYSAHRNRLFAAAQRQRLAQVRLHFPEIQDSTGKVCPIDFVRPVGRRTRQRIAPDQEIETSTSVYDRRTLGRELKQKLLRQELSPILDKLGPKAQRLLQSDDSHPFAMQIASISEAAGPQDLKANLRDKICVITLDGNGFGKKQGEALYRKDTIETQQEFDRDLALVRSQIIGAVLDRLLDLNGTGPACTEELEVRGKMGLPDTDVVRFEVLLWGGDEIMFIVPARTGWRLLEQIGDTIERCHLGTAPVSFAIGAAFCHHDAPIARIKDLADGLADHIKDLKPADGLDGKAHTHFLVEVLESFDHVGRDLQAHLMSRVPLSMTNKDDSAASLPRPAPAARVLNLAELRSLRAAALALQSGSGGKLSRGRLRETARVLHTGQAQGMEYRTDWAAYVQESGKQLSDDIKSGALPFIGMERFFSLADEYWDYLTPERLAAPAATGVPA